MGYLIYFYGYKFWVLGFGVGFFFYDVIEDVLEELINFWDFLYCDIIGFFF